MNKFTKGPWKIEENVITAARYKTKPDGDWMVVANRPTQNDDLSKDYSRNNWEANAHLIAAAPEMYEALEDLINQFRRTLQQSTGSNDHTNPEAVELMRDTGIFKKSLNALKKARGDL